MSTTTHIWTSWNGTKTPLPLMSDAYLKNAYIRCLEVICAENYKARETLYNCAGHILSDMDSTYMDKEKATKWLEYFKEEFEKRKLKLPKLDRTNIDFQYKDKQIRKAFKKEENRRFDELF